MNHGKIAVLSTSACRKDTWCSRGRTVIKAEPSDRLTELVKLGYTIYLITTRASFHPELDSFLLELIPEERRYLPSDVAKHMDGTAACFIKPWKKLFDDLGIEHPKFDQDWEPTWLEWRAHLGAQGVVV